MKRGFVKEFKMCEEGAHRLLLLFRWAGDFGYTTYFCLIVYAGLVEREDFLWAPSITRYDILISQVHKF